MTNKKVKLSADDRIFYIVVNIIMAIVFVIVLWPLVFIVSSSFSSKEAVMAGRVFLLPVDSSLEGYKTVFKTNEVLIGYRNTIFYTFAGTLINISLTMMAAYPLSRRDLPHRKALMFLFTFTMIFSGGMIPTYIIVSELGILNTPLAMILPVRCRFTTLSSRAHL